MLAPEEGMRKTILLALVPVFTFAILAANASRRDVNSEKARKGKYLIVQAHWSFALSNQ